MNTLARQFWINRHLHHIEKVTKAARRMALPNLSTLSLREAPAPTGEFITLSREAADELNESGEVEPISYEEYVPSRKRPEGSYFKVRNKYMNRDLPRPISRDTPLYGYKVYDAESLWGWVKDRYTIPHNRQMIWREDWMDLHERYDPEGDVPQRVARLPSLTAVQYVFEGSGDQRRLVRMEHPLSGHVLYYKGARDRERLVRIDELHHGGVAYYEGPKDLERLVRKEYTDGEVLHYEGATREERVVRKEYTDGSVLHYEGAQGEEHLVREEDSNNDVTYYEGSKGEERKVRREEAATPGIVYFYEGARGEERIVRNEFADSRFY